MVKGQILEGDKAFLLTCGKCKRNPAQFAVVIDRTGVFCTCIGCQKVYKIESPGGVVIANA
jgi:hypothetical protein